MAASQEHRTTVNTEKLDYSSPRTFTPKQKILLSVLPPLASGFVKSIDMTCRHIVRGQEHWDEISKNDQHFLTGTWHENLTLFLCMQRDNGYHTLTSYSFDGEMIARILDRFDIKALRGSSSQGGMKAISQMSIAVREVQMLGLTLDGPKGPRRQAKPGVAILAARTQLPILPMAATLTRCYRVRSWDRLALPLFFSTIAVKYGEPIQPPAEKTKKLILETTDEINISLGKLQTDLEEEFGVDPQLTDNMSS